MSTPERVIGDYEYRWECPSCHEHFGEQVMEKGGPCPKCGGEMDDAKQFAARPIFQWRPYCPPFRVLVSWERKRKQIRSSQEAVVQEFRECLDTADNPMETFEDRLAAMNRMAQLAPMVFPPEREDCASGAGSRHQTREKKP